MPSPSLHLKPPGQEVPVLVEVDGELRQGLLWAWCWVWPGEWRAWVKGDGLEGRAWPVDTVRIRSDDSAGE